MQTKYGVLVAGFTGALLMQWAVLSAQHASDMARFRDGVQTIHNFSQQASDDRYHASPRPVLPAPAPLRASTHIHDTAQETDKLRRLVQLQEKTMERILAASSTRMGEEKKRYNALQKQNEQVRRERDALKAKLVSSEAEVR